MALQFKDIVGIAYEVYEAKKFDQASNCKIMARRILHFEMEDITKKVKESLEKMHEFFMDSYKSVGCFLCDGATHAFIDVKKKTVTMNHNFCRTLTSRSLKVLLYLHVHYKKFYELASTFMSKCNLNGDFTKDAPGPNIILKIDETTKNNLNACKQFRNDSSWETSCTSICDEFGLAKQSELFFPDMLMYHDATNELEDLITMVYDEAEDSGIELSEEELKAKEEVGEADQESAPEVRLLERLKVQRDSRILAEEPPKIEPPKAGGATAGGATGPENPDQAKEKEKEKPKPPTFLELLKDAGRSEVFTKAPEGAKKLSEFVTVYDTKGGDLYEMRLAVNFEEPIYTALKAELEPPAKPTDGKATVEKKTSAGFWGSSEQRLFAFGMMLLNAGYLILA